MCFPSGIDLLYSSRWIAKKGIQIFNYSMNSRLHEATAPFLSPTLTFTLWVKSFVAALSCGVFYCCITSLLRARLFKNWNAKQLNFTTLHLFTHPRICLIFEKKSICNEEVQKYLSVSSFLACTLNRLLIHLRRCCCLWQMTHFWPREILSNFPRSCKGFQLHLDTLHYVLWCIVSSQELWRILKVKLADLSVIFF